MDISGSTDISAILRRGEPGFLSGFTEKVKDGDVLILCQGLTNWEYAIMHPEGLILQIDGIWFLNGVTQCPKPQDVDEHSTPHPTLVNMRRIVSNGLFVPFPFHDFEGHPHGAVFQLSDSTLALLRFRHKVTAATALIAPAAKAA